ncbi:MAG: hypothetical protein JWM95_1521 [Gemmatimonadetes bacterium]|nr:hypothetical protein [Gemmatimonadota bacterium]
MIPMRKKRITRAAAAAVLAFLILSCSDKTILSPSLSAPENAARSQSPAGNSCCHPAGALYAVIAQEYSCCHPAGAKRLSGYYPPRNLRI